MWIAFRSVDGFAKQSLTRNLGHLPLENSMRMGSQSLVCCAWCNGDPAKREPEQWLLNRMAARQGQTGEPFSEQGEGSTTLPIYCRLWDFSSDSCTKKSCAIRYSAKFLPSPKTAGQVAPLRRQRHMPDSMTTPRLERALGMFVLRKAEG